MDLSEYKDVPLSPWQREQAFEIKGRSGGTIRGHFVDGALEASYTMYGKPVSAPVYGIRVFVRAGTDVKQGAAMLRAMAAELEGVTLER